MSARAPPTACIEERAGARRFAGRNHRSSVRLPVGPAVPPTCGAGQLAADDRHTDQRRRIARAVGRSTGIVPELPTTYRHGRHDKSVLAAEVLSMEYTNATDAIPNSPYPRQPTRLSQICFTPTTWQTTAARQHHGSAYQHTALQTTLPGRLILYSADLHQRHDQGPRRAPPPDVSVIAFPTSDQSLRSRQKAFQ